MINKLKKVTISDIFGIFKYLVVFIPAFIYHLYLKLFNKQLWVICETKTTARDNGYAFFKYVAKKKNIKSYYVISSKADDYWKVNKFKNVIEWGSLKHYFMYCAATYNISSHKEGNPNQSLFTVLHVYLKLYNNRVFLQHGITCQYLKMYNKKNANFKYFICAGVLECEYIRNYFGYDKEVANTGFARYDDYLKKHSHSKTILFIPTWRRWITSVDTLKETEYYRGLNDVLNNDKIDKILEKYGYELLFLPHQGLQSIGYKFQSNMKHVRILNQQKSDVHHYLMECNVMITDFSSVQFDFAYMKKPIIYHQVDADEFYSKHIGASKSESYVDYDKLKFGEISNNSDDLAKELEKVLKNEKMPLKYTKIVDEFFLYHDDKNCERIYNLLIGEKYE